MHFALAAPCDEPPLRTSSPIHMSIMLSTLCRRAPLRPWLRAQPSLHVLPRTQLQPLSTAAAGAVRTGGRWRLIGGTVAAASATTLAIAGSEFMTSPPEVGPAPALKTDMTELRCAANPTVTSI